MDWNGLVVRLLHETQLQIIEAMQWIDRPMSASQLVHVFDESTSLSSVSYHVRRLRKLGIVKQSWIRPVRGTKERFYRLAPVGEIPNAIAVW
jgi:DNA-binding transcriptional regulator GbsR (MarR family)